MKIFLMVFLFSLTLVSCATHQVNDNSAHDVTVGTVQKEIKIGMNSVKVAQALGSPNIVQTDDKRNEVWIYDKISTQIHHSSSVAGVWVLAFAAAGTSSHSSRSQRTLTIIIKFDEASKVRDFAYHTSRF